MLNIFKLHLWLSVIFPLMEIEMEINFLQKWKVRMEFN